MNSKKILKSEKKKSLFENKENDHNPKYSVANRQLQNNSIIRTIDGIKTKKRTPKEYNEIWDCFVNEYSVDFENHMGYGLKEIESIGYEKFIDFVDWRTKEDIMRYRSDRIKTIPCCHCKNKFTTFQLDFGLCSDCKPLFDLKKFEEVLNSSEKHDPGSSSTIIIAFTFFEEFRKLYQLNLSLDEKLSICVNIDNLNGEYSKAFFINCIEKDLDINKILDCIEEFTLTESINERFKSIRNILLCSDISKQDKIERIGDVCKLKSIEKI